MDKEGRIKNITRKLCENVQLDELEIHTIISALRESEHCFQEPYYEVIYHDKYDNTETRIMNPVASRIIDMNGYAIQEDRFELNFKRAIRVVDDVADIRKSPCVSLKEKMEDKE